MKILRFDDDRIGVLSGENVVDISGLVSHREVRGPQGVMNELVGNFDRYKPEIAKLASKGSSVSLADIKLLPPLPHPSRVLAAFSNYVDRPDRSIDSIELEFFHKSPFLVGPGGTIELPDIEAVKVFHAEAELAFVIGKNSRNVSADAAMKHVFAYVPFFDVSARGLTRRSQLVPKGQETFAACGPWLTTSDEIADPYSLNVRSWINGELAQAYDTRYMAHKIPAQVAWLSRFVELRPCDVVATGVFHKGLHPINVGDTLDIEIGGLERARFRIGGTSPLKVSDFQPGGGGAMKITRV